MKGNSALKEKIQKYWNERIHDLAVAKHPVGTKEFFDELAEYRFDKLHYLPQLVDFPSYKGKKVLEIGSGAGIDLVRFSSAGADTLGIDLSSTAIELAKKNFAHRGLSGKFEVEDGEYLPYPDNSFDVVYCHGVLQYAADPYAMAREAQRVLKPGGEAIFMVYNRISWLNFMSKVMKVSLEHEDAPVLERYSISEFKKILKPFSSVRIVPERFPVKSRLHGGVKGFVYNTCFVGVFNLIPRFITRPLGWHLMAFCKK